MDTKVILKSDLPQPTDYLTVDIHLTYIPLLTVGKCYEAATVIFGNLLYDPNRYYLITCDDGYTRKFPCDYFITLEEWRDLQLEKLL